MIGGVREREERIAEVGERERDGEREGAGTYSSQ